MGKRRDLNWIIANGHFDKLVEGDKKNLFLVDTGVIIDLEDHYHNNGKQQRYNPAVVLSELEREYQLIITSGVLKEIERHTEFTKNDRYEISSSTSISVSKLYEESRFFFDSLVTRNISFDLRENHRYAVALSAFESFKKDYRKGLKDRISDTDKEILYTALDLARCSFNMEPIGTINVISTDNHVIRILNMLRNLNNSFQIDFSEYNLRGLNSRKDLRSYLLK